METTNGRAGRDHLTPVTRAIHVSRIISTLTLVNPNHAGGLEDGEVVKERESALRH